MRSRHLCVAGVAASFLIGCGGGGDDTPVVAAPVAPAAITCSTSAAQLTKTTLKVAGVDREYYDSAPVNYAALRENDARGITVLVNFHDAGQSGQDGAASTCWHEVGAEKGFVTVFPSALSGNWNSKSAATAADEVAFLKGMLPAI